MGDVLIVSFSSASTLMNVSDVSDKLHSCGMLVILFEMTLCDRNVSQLMKDDTVMLVLGDHGMTHTGDHGGDSEDELTAGLFVYSPAHITASDPPPPVRHSLDCFALPLLLVTAQWTCHEWFPHVW